jgi:hypothetical protein
MPVVRRCCGLMKRMALGHDVDSLAKIFASFKFHDYSTLANALKGAAEFGRSLAQTHNASKACHGTARVVEDGDHPHFWTMETGIASCCAPHSIPFLAAAVPSSVTHARHPSTGYTRKSFKLGVPAVSHPSPMNPHN